MKLSYTIDEPDLLDAGPVAQALWQRNLLGYDRASAKAKFDKAYVANPAGHGRIFMLKADGVAEACGTISLHPRSFWRGAKALNVVGLADFVVNAEHRSLVPALKLARHATQQATQHYPLTYATPNEKAAPVVSRGGLTHLGDMGRYAKPLRTQAPLARKLPRLVAVLSAPLLDISLCLADVWLHAHAGSGLVCQAASFDDPTLDSLWDERPPSTLLSERTAHMLKWRFTGRALGDAQVCVARDRNGQARGYVVWRERDHFFEVLDFLCVSSEQGTEALMLAFTRMARRLSAHSISVEFFGAPAVLNQLRHAGFRQRPGTLPVYASAAEDPTLVDTNHWHFTRFDDDTD